MVANTIPRGTPTIKDPATINMSNEMLALTPAQRRFVMAMVEFPDASQARAAAAAGYSGNDAALRATGWRLSHDPKIKAAIHSEAANRMGSAKILAASTLVQLLENPDPKIQLRAVEMVLNRTGLHAVSEHQVNVTQTAITTEEKLAKIKLLAADLGVDPEKLMGRAGVKSLENKVIDADFETVETGTEGLEDIL